MENAEMLALLQRNCCPERLRLCVNRCAAYPRRLCRFFCGDRVLPSMFCSRRGRKAYFLGVSWRSLIRNGQVLLHGSANEAPSPPPLLLRDRLQCSWRNAGGWARTRKSPRPSRRAINNYTSSTFLGVAFAGDYTSDCVIQERWRAQCKVGTTGSPFRSRRTTVIP